MNTNFKKPVKLLAIAIKVLSIVGIIYLLTLFFPQPFFKSYLTVGNITVYSDEEIPIHEMTEIVINATHNLEKSDIYKADERHNIFIVNNPALWTYFANRNSRAAGLAYVAFNHNIFIRKADMKDNRVYNPSSQKVGGDRTLTYFITHEMTHNLEFMSMPWYEYPINTNWTLEGYSEYVAYGSVSYETALDKYLNTPENSSAKYYTRVRTMVAYLLEKEGLAVTDLWKLVDDYDAVFKKAIPDDKPMIDESVR